MTVTGLTEFSIRRNCHEALTSVHRALSVTVNRILNDTEVNDGLF